MNLMDMDGDLNREVYDFVSAKVDELEDLCSVINSMVVHSEEDSAKLSMLIDEAKQRYVEMKSYMEYISQELQGDLLKRTMSYYQHIKVKASEGDEVAQKIFEEIHPYYISYLTSNMGLN